RYQGTDGNAYSNGRVTNCTIHDGLGGMLLTDSSGTNSTKFSNFWYINNECYNITCRAAFETSIPAVYPPTLYHLYANFFANNNYVHNVTGVAATTCSGITFEGVVGGTMYGNYLNGIGTSGLGSNNDGLATVSSTGIVMADNMVAA